MHKINFPRKQANACASTRVFKMLNCPREPDDHLLSVLVATNPPAVAVSNEIQQTAGISVTVPDANDRRSRSCGN